MFGQEFIEKFGNLNILIVGDVMLDRYWWGSVSRISPEAPVPVVNLDKTTLAAGGAANVAANVAGLGAKPYLVGSIGDDSEADLLNGVLEREGISTDFLVSVPHRRTTVKTRIVAHNQQVARVDQESKTALNERQEEKVWSVIAELLDKIQIIVISDYGKGLISGSLCQRLITHSRNTGKFVIVDPKGKNYQKYSGATILTPNRYEVGEVMQLVDFGQDTIEGAGRKMIEEYALNSLLITQGEDGMTLFEKGGCVRHLTVTARNVYDVTGAGDTVVACLACAYGSGESLSESAKFANAAAGLVVEKVGTTAISRTLLNQNDPSNDR